LDQFENEIHCWLKKFALCVRALDFESGKKMFLQEIYCFGSIASTLSGIDDLVENQWKQVWPNISDFDFDYKNLHFKLSDNNNFACILCPWTSTGCHPGGNSFQRPGRLTLILIKDESQNKWLAYHTHYSLNPGTPPKTHKHKQGILV